MIFLCSNHFPRFNVLQHQESRSEKKLFYYTSKYKNILAPLMWAALLQAIYLRREDYEALQEET
uniref:AlNc14C2G273 protein n=1 Tax=Albugo laibachii Nc14 TaxID=890382 RepID=F0VZD5_9STRA|nr:AlNc14C2G273 [Albugo laibachii Nc14]|eukprot:CCA14165.1 AlNc14C2G273 [Albugo laibachii Nc14]